MHDFRPTNRQYGWLSIYRKIVNYSQPVEVGELFACGNSKYIYNLFLFYKIAVLVALHLYEEICVLKINIYCFSVTIQKKEKLRMLMGSSRVLWAVLACCKIVCSHRNLLVPWIGVRTNKDSAFAHRLINAYALSSPRN